MGITSLKLLHGFLPTKIGSIQGFKPELAHKLEIPRV
jgi:hypothetical protein